MPDEQFNRIIPVIGANDNVTDCPCTIRRQTWCNTNGDPLQRCVRTTIISCLEGENVYEEKKINIKTVPGETAVFRGEVLLELCRVRRT